jgi:hypothetical protein
VVCLEQSGWVSSGDYPGNKPEWELLVVRFAPPAPGDLEETGRRCDADGMMTTFDCGCDGPRTTAGSVRRFKGGETQ